MLFLLLNPTPLAPTPTPFPSSIDPPQSAVPSAPNPAHLQPTAPSSNFPAPYVHNASTDSETQVDYDTVGFKTSHSPNRVPPLSPTRVDISSDSSHVTSIPAPPKPLPPS